MRIALVVDEELRDYVLDTFAKHPDFEGEVAYLPSLDKKLAKLSGSELPRYRGLPMLHLTRLNIEAEFRNFEIGYDTILVAIQDALLWIKILLFAILLGRHDRQGKEIFFIRSSCLRNKADFIANSVFDASCVGSIPTSSIVIALLADVLSIGRRVLDICCSTLQLSCSFVKSLFVSLSALPRRSAFLRRVCGFPQKTISAKSVAKQVYTTSDGVEAYEIEDVFVQPLIWLTSEAKFNLGYVYTSDREVLDSCINKYYGYPFRRLRKKPDIVYDREDICVLARLWSYAYYGHFLFDVCDKILVAEELGFKGRYMLFHNPDAEQLLAWMGIAPERVIWIEKEDAGKVYLVRKAFDVDGYNYYHSEKGLSRILAFADTIVNKITNDEDRRNYPRRLYVKRIGRRKLLDVDDILKKYDFFTMIPEEHSLEEEVKFFHYADIILSPMGTNSSNWIFMHKGAALVQTMPYDFHASQGCKRVFSRGLLHRSIIEDAPREQFQQRQQFGYVRDYRVNNDLLDHTLKELIERLEEH